VTAQKIEKFLGPPIIFRDQLKKKDTVGVATGVAWTASGGEILFVEAIMMKGKGHLLLTGSLGDVMKESAQAALSYTRAHAQEFGLDSKIFMENDFIFISQKGLYPRTVHQPESPSPPLLFRFVPISRFAGKWP